MHLSQNNFRFTQVLSTTRVHSKFNIFDQKLLQQSCNKSLQHPCLQIIERKKKSGLKRIKCAFFLFLFEFFIGLVITNSYKVRNFPKFTKKNYKISTICPIMKKSPPKHSIYYLLLLFLAIQNFFFCFVFNGFPQRLKFSPLNQRFCEQSDVCGFPYFTKNALNPILGG